MSNNQTFPLVTFTITLEVPIDWSDEKQEMEYAKVSYDSAVIEARIEKLIENEIARIGMDTAVTITVEEQWG